MLYPFDFNEYLLARGEQAVSPIQVVRNRNRLRKLCDDYLSEGGFPEVVLTGKKHLKKDILSNYAKNIRHPSFIVDTCETTMEHRCTQINTDRFIF